MCGYACVGCGRCGRKTEYGKTILCVDCGTENKKGVECCTQCGCRFAPGPGTKALQDSLTGKADMRTAG